MRAHRLPALALLPTFALLLAAAWPASAAAGSAHADTAPQRVPLKAGQDSTNTALQDYYSPDRSLRVQYRCYDDNLPGGANEGASNPANVRCMVSLFRRESGAWAFADEVDLGQGSVKKFAAYRLTVETRHYGMGDALCCPSVVATLVFDVRNGTFEEDLAAEGKPFLIKALEDGAEAPQVAALLAQGANVNTYDATGRTPLMLATEQGKTATVQLLLKRGAQVNPQRDDGRTALMLAVEGDAPELVKLLLDHGADANTRTRAGDTPLTTAIMRGRPDVMGMLLDHGAKGDAPGADGVTPLVAAVRFDSAKMAQRLLKHGANADLAAADGAAPVIAATSAGNAPIIALLAAKGANLNIEDAQGRTPLLLAVQQGRADIARVLLQAGADARIRDTDGRTPLLLAAALAPQRTPAETGELITLLLGHGADINAQDSSGASALLMLVTAQERNARALAAPASAVQGSAAPFRNGADLIRLLIDKGANLDVADSMGRTVLSWYAQRDCAMVRELLDKGAGRRMADPASALVAAARNGQDDCLRAMIDHGFDVNHRTRNLDTALAAAAGAGHLETVKLLLARGADPSEEAGWGPGATTPAKLAFWNRHPDIARLLQPLTHAPAPPAKPPMATADAIRIALAALALAGAAAFLFLRRKARKA